MARVFSKLKAPIKGAFTHLSPGHKVTFTISRAATKSTAKSIKYFKDLVNGIFLQKKNLLAILCISQMGRSCPE